MICEKHGDYERKAVNILGLEIVMKCPECQKEDAIQREKDEALELERKDYARVDYWLEKSRIPKIYRNAKFEPKATQQTKPYNYDKNIILLGSVGTGKTYYACSLAVQAIKKGITARYQLSPELPSRIKDTWHTKHTTEYEIIKDLSECGILVLDEVGRGEWTDWHFSVLNNRYNSSLPTILIGNVKAEELKAILGDALVSRLKGYGLEVYNFGSEDLR